LDSGKDVQFKTTQSRRIFIYVTNGEISINKQNLFDKDQVRMDLEEIVHIEALKPSSLILIDVPSCKGWGYDADTLKGKRI
jgi:redox-sensitive bicupin YhaK (pirin superfamily)